jgi:hypothetical protein
VRGAIGGQGHFNGWNGINGTVSNTTNQYKQHLTPFHLLFPAYHPSDNSRWNKDRSDKCVVPIRR